MKTDKLLNISSTLLCSLADANFQGFDPYDIKAHPAILKLIKWGNASYPMEVVREGVLEIINHFPKQARSLLGIQPTHNSKALGLLGTACIELSLLAGTDSKLISKSGKEIQELLNSYKTECANGGIGWGYPFNWQSKKLIPAQTPNGIVTTAVGEYFWTKFKVTGSAEALEQCKQIGLFLNSLPADQITPNQLCFSYVPHYQNHVHNLNLFVADFLIKAGQELGKNEWIEKGNKAISYTLANQLKNGAFDYNGPPEKPLNFIDNYHTGFVLRMLGSTYHYTQREDIKQALHKGLNFYIDALFTDEGIPKLKPDRTYRIDIHSAAEAINCLVFLANAHEKAYPTAQKVLRWTLTHLYDESEKDFYYAILKSRFTGRTYRSEIKYIRWAQAWMLRALSRYIVYSEQGKIII
jgi:hypothetical protein